MSTNIDLLTAGYQVDGGPVQNYDSSPIGDLHAEGILVSGQVVLGNESNSLTFKTLTSSLLANFEALVNGEPVTLDLGGSADELIVDTFNNLSENFLIDAGTGDDYVEFSSVNLTRPGTFEIQLGDGVDDFVIGDWSGGSDASIVVDGGDNDDQLELLGNYSDYTFTESGDDLLVTVRNSGATLTAKNFEDYIVGGTSYESIDDLINGGPGNGGGGNGGGGNGGGGSRFKPSDLVVPGGPTTIDFGTVELGIFVDTPGTQRLLPITPGTFKNALSDTLGDGNAPIFIGPQPDNLI